MNALTEHFSLEEMTRSSAAKRLGIDNAPSPSHVANLVALCREVLEPIRAHFAKPIVINSGYRCKAVNHAVGGRGNSQHMKGQAADIRCAGAREAHQIAEYVAAELDFDQVFVETNGTCHWVHVSYNADSEKNRRQVKPLLRK